MGDQPWATDGPRFEVDVTFRHEGDLVQAERTGYPTYEIDQATLLGAIIKIVGPRRVYDAIHELKQGEPG